MASKKLKRLTDWDWATLVAAWRYYQYRSTIVSATFPQNIYERYFTGEYAPPKKCRNYEFDERKDDGVIAMIIKDSEGRVKQYEN